MRNSVHEPTQELSRDACTFPRTDLVRMPGNNRIRSRTRNHIGLETVGHDQNADRRWRRQPRCVVNGADAKLDDFVAGSWANTGRAVDRTPKVPLGIEIDRASLVLEAGTVADDAILSRGPREGRSVLNLDPCGVPDELIVADLLVLSVVAKVDGDARNRRRSTECIDAEPVPHHMVVVPAGCESENSHRKGPPMRYSTDIVVIDLEASCPTEDRGNNTIDGSMATEWATNGDGNDAFIEIDLGASHELVGIGFRSREMANGSSIITSFELTFDGEQTLGPFDSPDPSTLYQYELDSPISARVVRVDAITTSGGNTGAKAIELYIAQ